jgi:D-alanyl-D-alanine carboxypeptidase
MTDPLEVTMHLHPDSLSVTRLALSLAFLLSVACGSAQADGPLQPAGSALPPGITEVMNDPLYAGTTWSLFVVDLDKGEAVYRLDPDEMLLIGPFTGIGDALAAFEAEGRIATAIYEAD